MKVILSLLFAINLLFAQMEYSDPQPDFENPRKMVVQIGTDDDKKIEQILNSVSNIMKEYPSGTLEVSIVAYYNGLKVLKKDDNSFKKRVESFMASDVEFIVCENTMTSKKWTKDMMIEDVSYVQAGLAEVMERVVDGWINIRP